MAFQTDRPSRLQPVPVAFFLGYAWGIVAGAFALADGTWWDVAFLSTWLLAIAYFLRRWRSRR